MPSWDEIRDHLRNTFNVVRDEPHAMALAWTITLDQGEFVQKLGLAPMTVDSRPWLTMIAEIAVEDTIPIRTALVYQDRLPFGGLVLRKGLYLLRHGVPLEETPLSELDWIIRLLADAAAHLRISLHVAPPSGEPFTGYED